MKTNHTCQSAQDAFCLIYKAGQAPNLAGKARAPFDTRRLPVLRSHWSTTFRYIAKVHGYASAGEVPVQPFFKTLDKWAFRASKAKHGTQSTANNTASSVRFICGAVFSQVPGRDYIQTPRSRELVPEAWRPGYDALDTKATNGRHGRYTMLGWYIDMATLAGLNGCTSPYALPTAEVLLEWAIANGQTQEELQRLIRAVGRAGELLGEPEGWPQFPSIPQGYRSIRHIPFLADKLQAAGCTAHPDHLSLREIGEVLYPRLDHAFGHYLAYLEGRVHEGSMESRRLMFSHLAFTLDSLSFPQQDDLVDMYTKLVAAAPASDDSGLVPLGASGQPLDKRAPAPGSARSISYARAVLESWGRASAAHTPLYLIRGGGGTLPFYTSTVSNEMDWLLKMTQVAHRDNMLSAPDEDTHQLWQKVEVEGAALKDRISDHNKGRDVGGRVNPEKLVTLISLPQVQLLGLPALRKRAHEARARWQDSLRKDKKRLLSEYLAVLWDWALAVIWFLDSLRPKNYAGALANKHVHPVWQGSLIVGASTRFRGIGDEECVTLKKYWADGSKSEENSRVHDIHPAHFDSQLFTDFWVLARPRNLVQSQALPDLSAFDVHNDHFAVFPSPQSVERSSGGIAEGTLYRTGRYSSPSPLSDQLGKITHWMICDIMRRSGMPDWNDRAITTEYRGLFGGHKPARVLNASFWGYEADEWGYAQWLTNDTLDVLKRHYARMKGQAAAERERQRTGVDGLRHFVTIMQHVRNGGLVTWDRFDPMNPDRAIVR